MRLSTHEVLKARNSLTAIANNTKRIDAAQIEVLKAYLGKMSRLQIENKHGLHHVDQKDGDKWLKILDEQEVPGFPKFSDPELGTLDARFVMALKSLQDYLAGK